MEVARRSDRPAPEWARARLLLDGRGVERFGLLGRADAAP